MTFRKTSLLLSASLLSLLSACAEFGPGFEEQSGQRIEDATNKAAEKARIAQRGGVVDAQRAYLGSDNISADIDYAEDFGKPLPARFEQSKSIRLVTPEPVDVEKIDLLLEELTGLSVVVRTRYQDGEEELRLPINGAFRINYEGPLSGLLSRIASDYDLAWSFDGNQITFDRMPTRSYDLVVPPSTGAVSASMSGVSGGVSSSKNIEYDPWKEIAESLALVVEEPGKISISKNAGKVIVFATASQQREAAKILQSFNDLYSRRIGVEVATFYIDSSKSATKSLGASLNDLGGADLAEGVIRAINGGIGVVASDQINATVNLSGISASSAVADYQMSNTVTQNGVVAPVVIANERSFVSSIERTEEGGTTVTPDTVKSGLSVYALPRLMKNGKIHMSIWINQSSLNRLDSFDTGSGSIQLPDTDERAMEYTLIMEPGETLVMGGYEQDTVETEEDRGGSLVQLGKSKEGSMERSRMVLMVRPSIVGKYR